MQSQGHPQGPLQRMYWKGIPQIQSPRHPLGPLQGMLNLGMGITLAGVRVMPREQLQEQFSYDCLSDAFRYHKLAWFSVSQKGTTEETLY